MARERSPVEKLERSLGQEWSGIRKARQTTADKRALLDRVFQGKVARDTSVVLFGSIARDEMTSGSDADWILLVDGQAVPEHEDQKRDIARSLKDNGFGEPGSSGIFGTMVGSHSLVDEIGGEDDTNSNTTRRSSCCWSRWQWAGGGRCETQSRASPANSFLLLVCSAASSAISIRMRPARAWIWSRSTILQH
jgi:predicted nucleotidyltransferase